MVFLVIPEAGEKVFIYFSPKVKSSISLCKSHQGVAAALQWNINKKLTSLEANIRQWGLGTIILEHTTWNPNFHIPEGAEAVMV